MKAMLSDDDLVPGLVDRAAAESAGNPALLDQLLRVYCQHGILTLEGAAGVDDRPRARRARDDGDHARKRRPTGAWRRCPTPSASCWRAARPSAASSGPARWSRSGAWASSPSTVPGDGAAGLRARPDDPRDPAPAGRPARSRLLARSARLVDRRRDRVALSTPGGAPAHPRLRPRRSGADAAPQGVRRAVAREPPRGRVPRGGRRRRIARAKAHFAQLGQLYEEARRSAARRLLLPQRGRARAHAAAARGRARALPARDRVAGRRRRGREDRRAARRRRPRGAPGTHARGDRPLSGAAAPGLVARPAGQGRGGARSARPPARPAGRARRGAGPPGARARAVRARRATCAGSRRRSTTSDGSSSWPARTTTRSSTTAPRWSRASDSAMIAAGR